MVIKTLVMPVYKNLKIPDKNIRWILSFSGLIGFPYYYYTSIVCCWCDICHIRVSKSEKITHLKILMLKKIEFSCEFNICVHISITYCGRLHSQADIKNHSQHPTYKTKEKWFKKCVIGWSNDRSNNLYYLLIKLLSKKNINWFSECTKF